MLHALQRGKSKSTEPLKPIELNLERLSISPSPVEKRKAPHRSDSPSFKRDSQSGSIESIEEPQEHAERDYKRRRIFFPDKEEYAEPLTSRKSASGSKVSQKRQADATPEAGVQPRSRFDMFRYVSSSHDISSMLTGDPVGSGASIVSVFTSKQPLAVCEDTVACLSYIGYSYFLLAPDLSMSHVV
jgi:hypothetical protein